MKIKRSEAERLEYLLSLNSKEIIFEAKRALWHQVQIDSWIQVKKLQNLEKISSLLEDMMVGAKHGKTNNKSK